MARIRTIKPGFFTHDVIGELPQGTRLLFIGLLCHADREGRLTDRPKRIKVEILPYDDCDVNAMLDELAQAGLIERYAINGERYLQVVNFSKHQHVHPKEAPSLIPAPPCIQEMPGKETASPEITGKDTDEPGRKGRRSQEGKEEWCMPASPAPPNPPTAEETPKPYHNGANNSSRAPTGALEPLIGAVEQITGMKRAAGVRESDEITKQAIALRELGFSPPEAVEVARKSRRLDYRLNFLARDLQAAKLRQTAKKERKFQMP